MHTNLHKRIEEAAALSAIEDTSKGRKREEYIISAIADHENGFREGFLAGAEYGYKEAIKVAKEWLMEHLPTPDWYSSTEELVADFETDMNKLLEEKK